MDPALDRLLALVDSDDERVALSAVRLVLDRAAIDWSDPEAPPLNVEMVDAEIRRLEAELEMGEG